MDYYVLRSRLSAVLDIDKNAVHDGSYRIHSLYFDNLYDKALLEKSYGINEREKFRIRYYNDNIDFIKLEKKSKIDGLCHKISEIITYDECMEIINGNIEWMRSSDKALFRELYSKMKTQLLKPCTVITYDRNPFIYKTGNVRITLDYNIRTSMYNIKDFFNIDKYNVPVINDSVILEIKYDEFLPGFISDLVNLDGRFITSYSKYERGRSWG